MDCSHSKIYIIQMQMWNSWQKHERIKDQDSFFPKRPRPKTLFKCRCGKNFKPIKTPMSEGYQLFLEIDDSQICTQDECI
jgi:hypothetical protein